MAIDIQKIAEQVNQAVAVLDFFKWIIGGYIAISSSLFVGFITFMSNWISRISKDQSDRIDGTYELIETDISKIEDELEKAKSDLYSKVNSTLQVLSAIHENIENIEKKVDRIQRICDETHRGH